MDSGNLTGAGTHCSYGIKNFFLINRWFAEVGQDKQLTESVFTLIKIIGIKKVWLTWDSAAVKTCSVIAYLRYIEAMMGEGFD